MHGIIVLADEDGVGAGLKPAPTGSEPDGTVVRKRHGLPEIVRGFKTFAARRINEHRRTPGRAVAGGHGPVNGDRTGGVVVAGWGDTAIAAGGCLPGSGVTAGRLR